MNYSIVFIYSKLKFFLHLEHSKGHWSFQNTPTSHFGMVNALISFQMMFTGEEGRLLAETLLNTFVQRVGRIQTCSLNSMTKPKKLDTCEKQLHAIGVRTQSLMNDWTKGITSDMKRKASSTII